MNRNINIPAIFFVIIAVPLAIYLGFGAATEGFETSIVVIGAGGLLFSVFLGRRIWLVFIFLHALGLSIAIPGQPTTMILGQLVLVGFCSLLFLMRRLPVNFKVGELEVLGVLFLIVVAQSYIRNPVGLNVLGTESVGGRPYALLVLTIAASYVLSILTVQARELRQMMWVWIGGGLISGVVSVVGYFVPVIGVYFGAATLSQAQSANSGFDSGGSLTGTSRVSFLAPTGTLIARTIGSLKSPISACFHPVFAPFVLVSFLAAGLSGYRSSMAMIGLSYLVAIYYRNGVKGLALSGVALSVGVALLAFVNLATPLPPNVQRALTILPGTWDERIKREAELSTDWRVEMWEEVLTTDRYIKNKWLGDGMGLSRHALQRAAGLQESKATVYGGWDVAREIMMLTGDFHSGPVQTIRVIGYLGLAVLVFVQFRLVVHAHRQIERSRGSNWFAVTLFVGIPIIWNPLFFLFVFGTFSGAANSLIMGIALIRLLEKNLPLPAYVARSRRHGMPTYSASAGRMTSPEGVPVTLSR